MAAEPTREWSEEQLKSDDLPKKDIIKFIQDNAAQSVRGPLASAWPWLHRERQCVEVFMCSYPVRAACVSMELVTIHKA